MPETTARRIKKFAFPLSAVVGLIWYFLIMPNFMFSVSIVIALLVTAFDEYWQRMKILKSPERLIELKKIEKKRQASVYVNGGIRRELKHGLLFVILVVLWFYFK